MTAKPSLSILATVLLALFIARIASLSRAAEVKPATWQTEWDKTIRAAEEEGAVNIYMTSAFESVFRDAFQKKYPKIKVT